MMQNDPLIVGWAHTKFGKSEAPDTMALMAEVARPALDHAGIPPDAVDGIFAGVWNNGFSRQDFQGALVAMGTPELAGVPFMRTENACATGSAALYAALDFIEAGRGKIALVVGVPQMLVLASVGAVTYSLTTTTKDSPRCDVTFRSSRAS